MQYTTYIWPHTHPIYTVRKPQASQHLTQPSNIAYLLVSKSIITQVEFHQTFLKQIKWSETGERKVPCNTQHTHWMLEQVTGTTWPKTGGNLTERNNQKSMGEGNFTFFVWEPTDWKAKQVSYSGCHYIPRLYKIIVPRYERRIYLYVGLEMYTSQPRTFTIYYHYDHNIMNNTI